MDAKLICQTVGVALCLIYHALLWQLPHIKYILVHQFSCQGAIWSIFDLIVPSSNFDCTLRELLNKCLVGLPDLTWTLFSPHIMGDHIICWQIKVGHKLLRRWSEIYHCWPGIWAEEWNIYTVFAYGTSDIVQGKLLFFLGYIWKSKMHQRSINLYGCVI
jgi:hypothetical protein